MRVTRAICQPPFTRSGVTAFFLESINRSPEEAPSRPSTPIPTPMANPATPISPETTGTNLIIFMAVYISHHRKSGSLEATPGSQTTLCAPFSDPTSHPSPRQPGGSLDQSSAKPLAYSTRIFYSGQSLHLPVPTMSGSS